MRRFFTNNKPLLTILSIVAVLFVIPGVTHAAGILPAWMGSGTSFFESIVSSPLEIFLLPAASFIMYIGGNLMDVAINFGLHTAYIFSLSPAINLGWVIVRDICNIFFIFVLIYISLGTIIKGTSFGTKSLLTQVIIAALLINFSLFFTKVVVDVSNVFGLWLYGGITKTLTVNSAAGGQTSLSGLIASRLEILQFGASNATPNQNPSAVISTDPSKSFVGRIIRLAIVLIATYIFFYTSVLFLARSITLLFLMVFSPIGFMGGVLPQIKEYADDWKKELTTAAMFPIVYLLMLYISLQFINSLELLKSSFPEAAKNNGDFTIAQYFQYFIIIFMLQACLNIAKKNSGKLGSTMGGLADTIGKFAVNAGVGIASGGTALVARAGMAAAFAKPGADGKTDRFKAAREVLPPSAQLVNSFMNTRKVSGNLAGLKAAGTDILNSTKKAAENGTWNIKNAKIPGIGENLGSTIGALTGVKINDAQSAKDLKTEKGEWTEERKIETANQKILAQIRDIEKAKAVYEGSKTPENKRILDAAIKKSQGLMSDASSGLSNKQLEKLNKAALKDENFIQSISQNQAEHLAEKTDASDEDKAKIWKTRLSDVNNALGTPGGDIKKAIKNHSDKELENLPAETLRKPEFVNARSMNYEKFSALMKSSKISNATKTEMKTERYKAFYKAVKEKKYNIVKEELKELDAPEIAKMDWVRKEEDGTEFDVLKDPEVIYSLDTKVLGKMYEELNTNQLSEIRRTVEAVVTSTPKSAGSDKYDHAVDPSIVDITVKKRLEKTANWLLTNNIGKEF